MTERDEIRQAIDRLDRHQLRLLEDRAELARRIGALKQAAGEATLDAARERDLIEKIEREAKGSLPGPAVRAIFREIVSASRAMQGAFRVAYLGAEGGFAHQAATRRFGASSVYAATLSPQHLLEAIGSERAEHGVFALEGDAEDPPFDAYDLLLGAEASITAEFVDHGGYEALGRTSTPRRLIAHPAALALCQRWRSTLGAGVEVIPAAGSLDAGRRAAGDPDAVCLAPAIVADLAGLPTLEREAEDAPRRTRRFLVLGRTSAAASGRDKSALLVSLENTPGALLEALRALADHGVNLFWIESRTHRWRPGEHLFLLEVAGHQNAEPLCAALEAMRARTRLLRVLGSFPAAETGW